MTLGVDTRRRRGQRTAALVVIAFVLAAVGVGIAISKSSLLPPLSFACYIAAGVFLAVATGRHSKAKTPDNSPPADPPPRCSDSSCGCHSDL